VKAIVEVLESRQFWAKAVPLVLFKYYFVKTGFQDDATELKIKSAFCGYLFHTLGGKITLSGSSCRQE
jgi:hypothetical protein